jgi:hypothetical protein
LIKVRHDQTNLLWQFGGTFLVEVEVLQEVTASRVAGDQAVEVGMGSNGKHPVSSWDILFILIGKMSFWRAIIAVTARVLVAIVRE